MADLARRGDAYLGAQTRKSYKGEGNIDVKISGNFWVILLTVMRHAMGLFVGGGGDQRSAGRRHPSSTGAVGAAASAAAGRGVEEIRRIKEL